MTEVEEIRKRLQARIPKGWWSGIDIDDGWIPIVDRLDKALAEINPDYEIHQVKEKFGGLRFYTGAITEEGDRLVAAAEEESYRTCEICGKQDGSVKTETSPPVSYWVKTLCGDDREKWKQEHIDRNKGTKQN